MRANIGRVAENACKRLKQNSADGNWVGEVSEAMRRKWYSQKTLGLIKKMTNLWCILIFFLDPLFIWKMVSDHPFSGSSKDLPESSTLDFFKLLGPEMLERNKTAPFVWLEPEKEANQAAGRSRFCSITIFREDNKESYNLFKCKIGKWLF